MNSNLWLVLGTATLFGLATGIYEYVLPSYLKSQGISFETMGLIFTLAGAAMVMVRIYMGGLSDLLGRKPLYGMALVVCGLGTASPAVVSGLLAQLLLKIVRDTAALTRETLFPIILYEERRGAFLNIISKFRGVEFLVQAGGTLLAGAVIAAFALPTQGYRYALAIAGGALLLAAIGWALAFREHPRTATPTVMTLRELFNFDLHPNLRIIMLAGGILTFGIALSHSFYMPLFFPERFPDHAHLNPLLMSLHRVTIALPMLVVGNLPIRNLRAWYCWGFVIEGVTMSACALLPNFWASAGTFLLHDLIGAGIWVPIQATLIQRFSRDERRGVETGKVLAWTSLGAVVGPMVAGWLLKLGETTPALAEASIIFPFFFSGVFMIIAAVPLLWLKLDAPTAAAVAEPAV